MYTLNKNKKLLGHWWVLLMKLGCWITFNSIGWCKSFKIMKDLLNEATVQCSVSHGYS